MPGTKNLLTIAADNGGTNSGGGAGGGGYSTLQYGSSGASVKELQQTLNRLGYNVGTADGIFGNNTKNAVLQYQKDNGLTADGIVGANTWNALRTPATPTSTPSVDYAGIIADLDKQQGGFQNAAAPTAAADRVQTATVSGTPNTAGVKPTAVAYDDGTSVKPAVSGTPSTAGVKPTAVYFDDVTAVKTPSTSGTPNTAGVKPTAVAYDDGTSVKPAVSGTPNTAGVKPTAVAFNDTGPDYVAEFDAAAPAADAAKLGKAPVTPVEVLPDNPVTQPDATVGNLPTPGVGYPSPTATQHEKPVGNTQEPAPSVYQTAISDIDTASGRTPEPVSPAAQTGIDYSGALDTAPTEIKRPERGENRYEQDYAALLEELRNYPAFQYDKNADPLWASLAKQYRREGQRATADALGQAAGLTGGIASSAAVTAASQAGDYYASQLSDRLRDVYNQKYQEYVDEFSRKAGLLPDYLGGANFLEGQYVTDLGQFNADRNAAIDQKQLQIDNAMAIVESLGYVPDEATAQILGIPVGTSTQSKTYQDWQMEYNNRQQEYDQQQRQIQNAMAIVESIGYVPDQSVADIMGLPVGTTTQSKAYQDWQMRFAEQQEAYDQYYSNAQLALSQQRAANGSNGGGGGGDGGNISGYSSIFDRMAADGVSSYDEAKAWMMANYSGKGKEEREEFAQIYVNSYLNAGGGTGDAISAGLRELFPDGVVTDPQVWAAVEKEYGADYLQQNGFRYRNVAGEYRAENNMEYVDTAAAAAKKWADKGFRIGNAHTDSSITISGLGTVSYAELARMVEAGTVIETVNGTKKTVTYTLAG